MIDRFRPWVRPATTTVFVLFITGGGLFAALLESFWPGAGKRLVEIQAAWLRAIPDPAYQLMGATILGYFGAREAGRWAERKFTAAAAEKSNDEPG